MAELLRRRWMPWAIYGGFLASLVPLTFVTYAMSPKAPETTNCGGIGFGEQPCGWDAVGLTMIFFVAPYVLITALALAFSELFGDRVTSARSLVAIVSFAVPWALAAYSALRFG